MILIVALLIGAVGAQDDHPCPDILKYVPVDEGSNKWNAALTVNAPQELDGVWIRIDLDKKADVLINSFAETTTGNNQNFMIKKVDELIPRGGLLSLTLTVKFGDKNNIPRVSKITINGFLVCPGRHNVTLHPVIRGPGQDICGTVPQAVGLIYNGKEADEGAWPWHVALMKIVPPSVDYICGGSIITKKFILTAAHCVTQPRTKTIVGLHTFLIYFGLAKLSHIPASATTSTMSNIIIPDDYNPERLYNDIALILLPFELSFTDFIRPVCLWAGDVDQSAIVGKQGTVIGFGVDNKNASFSSTLMEAKIPIVSLETCRSTDEFYLKYTTDKTFCAGGSNDVSACPGDSGGGMIFPIPGTSGSNTIWQLRGVVSLSKRPDGNDVCDTKNLVIFTDVPKHMDWIRQHAKLS